jgi:hypothetical protein
MADVTINTPPVEPQKRPLSPSVFLPPVLFLLAMLMTGDFAALRLHTLAALRIPYPKWLDYSHIVIPGACGVIWLVSLRKLPNAGAIVAVLLCFTLMPLVPQYAESKVAKVAVIQWIDSDDLESMESRLGVPVFEQGGREGTFVVVAPANVQRVRTELARLKLLGGAAAE